MNNPEESKSNTGSDILKQIKTYLDEQKIPSDFDEEKQSVIIRFEGENAYWSCHARLEAGQDLDLLSKIPIKCPEPRRNECVGLLWRLNDTLTYESFWMDLASDEIFFVTSVPVVEGNIEEMIEYAIKSHRGIADEAMPKIAEVIFGELPDNGCASV